MKTLTLFSILLFSTVAFACQHCDHANCVQGGLNISCVIGPGGFCAGCGLCHFNSCDAPIPIAPLAPQDDIMQRPWVKTDKFLSEISNSYTVLGELIGNVRGGVHRGKCILLGPGQIAGQDWRGSLTGTTETLYLEGSKLKIVMQEDHWTVYETHRFWFDKALQTGGY